MRALPVLLALLLAAGCLGVPGAERALRVGSTTSTHDSGLMDDLLPRFEADTGIAASAVVAGSGEVLAKAARGDVDVLLTHSPGREREFVTGGRGLARTPVMHNRFLLVGPLSDPVDARGAANATQALARIAAGAHGFVSRGDASGTHDQEVALWRAAGLDPTTFSSWYRETGAGQAQTLLVANEKHAYALTDEATWAQLNASGKVPTLIPVSGDDPALRNPYAVIPVKGPREADAQTFAAWLTGPRGQAAIAAYRVAGTQVFFPDAHPRGGAP